jgi:hypothetical protein
MLLVQFLPASVRFAFKTCYLYYSGTLGYIISTLTWGTKDLKIQNEYNMVYTAIQMCVENRGSLVGHTTVQH